VRKSPVLAAAKEWGHKRYFTGKPCIRGHVADRLASTRKCMECSRENDAQRYAEHTEEEKARSRKYQRKNLPIPTRPCPELCELCGKPPSGTRGMHLDHDHKTNLFRGWLCPGCNTGLGKFGDSIEGLKKALAYLIRNTTETQ